MTRPALTRWIVAGLIALITTVTTPKAGAESMFLAESEGTFETSGSPPILDVIITQAFTSSSPFDLATAVLTQKVNVAEAPSPITDGEFTFVATSGDELYGTYTGVATATSASELELLANFQFSGGTGAFAGLVGSGTATGLATFTSQTAGDSSLSWSGTFSIVPEPSSMALVLSAGAGLGAVISLGRRRS